MTNSRLNVLILAAGLGTRLRPLTSEMPKPLVPIVDKSILEHLTLKVKVLGDVCVHVNTHYLSEQIEVEAKRLGIEKVWLEYPSILGTGAPLKRIFNEGYRGGLLVINGDAFFNFDLKKFVLDSQNSNSDVSLLAIDFPNVNTFRVNENEKLIGIINRFGNNNGIPATFSGVSWYSDNALSRIRDNEFDIREFWKEEFKNGNAPRVDLSQKNSMWIDMGSKEGLMNACRERLKELNVDSWKSDSVFVTKNSIIFSKSDIKEAEFIENEIRGKNFIWKL